MRWLLALLLLCACDPGPGKHYWESRPAPREGRVILTWKATDHESIPGYCGGREEALACAVTMAGSEVCTIYFVPPKDFNDRDGLLILGHEAWHCMGAKHE